MDAFQRDPELAATVLQRANTLVIVGPWQRHGDNWMRLPVGTTAAKGLPQGWYFSAVPKTSGGMSGHVVGRVGEVYSFAVVPTLEEAARLTESLILSAVPGALIAQPGPPPGIAAAPVAPATTTAPPRALPQHESPTIIEAASEAPAHVTTRFAHPVR